jgi:hypothetical protein
MQSPCSVRSPQSPQSSRARRLSLALGLALLSLLLGIMGRARRCARDRRRLQRDLLLLLSHQRFEFGDPVFWSHASMLDPLRKSV